MGERQRFSPGPGSPGDARAEPAAADSATRTSPTHTKPAVLTVDPTAPQAADGALNARPVAGSQDPSRYRFVGEHGRGGLGRVSRMHDCELGRDIAIKELLRRDDLSEIRFLREALITARLEHPSIVPVHEAGRWPDGTPFYAMKLVSGRPLRELLAERRVLDQRLALLHHVIAVADAIAYAHDRQIIHRDLKPSNVMVGEFGETIVIDWGLAKDLRSSDDAASGLTSPTSGDDGLTKAGAVMGTPAYMAPEQARGEPVDQRADVFAIGAMLWELCAVHQTPPADRGERSAVLRGLGIDDDLAAIISKAIEPDPARRYPHAGALAADLKAFKAGARITSRDYSLVGLLAHWMRRHRALAASLVALAILLIGSVVALAGLAGIANRNAETAHGRLLQSYVEHGRQLLLDGDYLRALTYLAEAYAEGDDSIAVRSLLARARRFADSEIAIYTHANLRGGARAVGFRPDGKSVMSIGDTGEAAVWDANTGRALATLPNPDSGEHVGRVSRDGQFAAIPSADRGITLWDGVRMRSLGRGRVARVAFDARGARIAGVGDGELSVWDVKTGERAWTAPAPKSLTQLGLFDDSVVIFGHGAGSQPTVVISRQGIVPIATSAPTRILAIGAASFATLSLTAFELWDARGTRLCTPMDQQEATTNGAFSIDGTQLAISSGDGVVRIYNTQSCALVAELHTQHGTIASMEFTDDGTRLATTGADMTVRIWDVVGRRPLARLLGARGFPGLGVLRFDARGERVLAPTATGQVRVLRASEPDLALRIDTREDVDDGNFLADGARFTTSGPTALRTWSVATGEQLAKIDVPLDSFTVVSPDETKVVVVNLEQSDRDGEIRDLATGKVLATLHGMGDYSMAAFDHAGKRVALGSRRGTVELWSVSGERLATLQGHVRKIHSIAFRPDDREVLTASADQTTRLWDPSSGRELRRMPITTAVRSAVYDASGRWIVTAASERIVQLWDAAMLVPLRTFEHAAMPLAVAVNRDATLIAAASRDTAVSVWETETSSLIAQLHHRVRAVSVAFSPDGERLLSTSYDDHVALWQLGLERRSPAEVRAFARCRSPYRLVETRLEPAVTECAGK